jgi:microcystin degradation protein MlrC
LSLGGEGALIRLAALGLYHEANTFTAQRVDAAAMESAGVLHGQDIVARHAHGTTAMSGFLAAAGPPDVTVVPLVMTYLVPGGMIASDVLVARADELSRALADNGPFDGVLAALHGAAVAVNCHDVDGYLLRRMRKVVGPQVPIGAALDLHANVSAQMCAHADVLSAYRTNPHADAAERGKEVAGLILRSIRGEIRPVLGYQPVPAVISILRQATATAPMSEIMADADACLAEPGVLSVSVAEGYPYADVPEMGMSVIVVADGDRSAAERHARALGARAWARREQFSAWAPSATEALRAAALAAAGPVLLLDVGDNIGGGSPGDSVVILNAARDLGFGSLLAVISDPGAAAACGRAGVGAEVALSIGGRGYPGTGPPVQAAATVLALHDGIFVATAPVHAGRRHFDAGHSAAVRLDTGQTVILTSRRVPPYSPAQLSTLGLGTGQFKAIVAKGVHSPLPGYGPHVTGRIPVDTPGATSADLSRFSYRNRRHPLYPFEPEARFPVG